VNVEGTLALARRMEQVHYSVSCTWAQQCHVRRSRIHWSPKARNSERTPSTWWNTRSKSTIEQLMRQQCPNLPLLRPSVHRGRPYPSRLHALEQYFLGLQHGPDAAKIYVLDGRPIDVVPVDYCADALLMLLNSNARPGKLCIFLRGREQRSLCGY
jgi:hypothetical protein